MKNNHLSKDSHSTTHWPSTPSACHSENTSTGIACLQISSLALSLSSPTPTPTFQLGFNSAYSETQATFHVWYHTRTDKSQEPEASSLSRIYQLASFSLDAEFRNDWH